MKKRSLQSMTAQLRKATDAAVENNRKLTQVVENLGQELVFRSAVTGILEEYRQEIVNGKPKHGLKDVMDRVESFFVVQAMEEVDGNIAHAAQLLKLPEATLRYKMGKHGLR